MTKNLNEEAKNKGGGGLRTWRKAALGEILNLPSFLLELQWDSLRAYRA